MFTGIVEETGKIRKITNNYIEIGASKVLENTNIGDSICVNGVCLTVTNIKSDCFSADISPETLKVTMFGEILAGDVVNLERAMPANGRFGGHIVTGHIDGIGKLMAIDKNSQFFKLMFKVKDNQARYIVKKGSISIDGISLTVADIINDILSIAVIPHTYQNTNLKNLKIGEFVNIETDILAKHVEKFLSTSDNKSGIDYDFLKVNGYL